MKTKSVFVKDYMKLTVMERELPEIKANEVLVKTMACGLCCWDSWLYRGVNAPGPMPYVMGHEGAGIVEQVGSLVTHVKPGDKVFCVTGGNSDAMSEYFINRADGVYKLPDDVTDWAGVVYEPTSCVVNLLNITDIHMGDHVVLVGAGYMGLLTLQGLTRASQAGRITVFELREDRRKMAEEYNPGCVFDPNSEEGKKCIEEIKANGGADVVIDFGASDSGFHLADSMTKRAGKFVIGSFHRGEVKFYGPKWHLDGLTVYNLSPFANAHYPDMVPRVNAMIERGIFEPAKFITHTAYFEDDEAMDFMFRRACDKEDGYMKGAILFYK